MWLNFYDSLTDAFTCIANCIFFFVNKNPLKIPSSELTYILGDPMGSRSPVVPSANQSRADIAASEAFINYISNFVRNG